MSEDERAQGEEDRGERPEGAPETEQGDSGPAYDPKQAGVEEERDEKLDE